MNDEAPEPLEGGDDMELYDIRVVVDRIEGRSVCGMQVGDCFEVRNSAQLGTNSPSGHFCLYAIQAVLPMIPASSASSPTATGWRRTRMWRAPTPRSGSSCASTGASCARCAPRT